MKKLIFLTILIIILPIQTGAVANTPVIQGDENVSAYDKYLLINWTIVDDNPKSYEIQLNNSGIVGSGSWDENHDPNNRNFEVQLAMDVDIGIFVLELTVIDYDNYQVSFTTKVTITLNTDTNPAPIESNIIFIGLGVLMIFRRRNQRIK